MLADEHKITRLGLSVLEIEARAISALAERIDSKFVAACQTILKSPDRSNKIVPQPIVTKHDQDSSLREIYNYWCM